MLFAAALAVALAVVPPQDPMPAFAALPVESAPPAEDDWLLDSAPFRARAERSADGRDLILSNGLARRVWRMGASPACWSLERTATGEQFLRAVRPEARVTIGGREVAIGGLDGQRNHAFLDRAQLDAMTAPAGGARCVSLRVGPIAERFPWKRVRHAAPDAKWPPTGVCVEMDFDAGGAAVTVRTELYDGLPLFSKSIAVRNGGAAPITVDRCTVEILAAVESESRVDPIRAPLAPSNLHVEADFAFAAMTGADGSSQAVRWISDPQYSTQVNYERTTPCLLEAAPPIGPAQAVAPGGVFESFRVYELLLDSADRERSGLSIRRMQRAIAPWVTENPLLMHIRSAEPKAVKLALDQCADAGFEAAILTFGSGVDLENEDPKYAEELASLAAYARERMIDFGAYSLLASRSVNEETDVVNPKTGKPGGFARFDNSPCLQSKWGVDYFNKLRCIFDRAGLMVLEHDGSYPGDACASARHPGHRGYDDSQWTQWKEITDFYHECRARGIYLNVPDWYFTQGSSKNGMGYRESNWSLPRDEQVIHTRQNIYDGTWEKTPSMGWMFVPLTEYQGGGAAATIEPLDEHLDHYQRMLASNFALGVQACWRGPRLYDTERVRAAVKAQVAWFHQYRDILESDLIHGRRADGRDVDWMLHVNPKLDVKAMLVAFNPLPTDAVRTLRVPLYYAGLRGRATVSIGGAAPFDAELDGRRTAMIPITIPARGWAWAAIR